MRLGIRYSEIGAEQTLCERACDWIRLTERHVELSEEADGVVLISERHDAVSLQLIWESALANECLVARAADTRSDIIQVLVG